MREKRKSIKVAFGPGPMYFARSRVSAIFHSLPSTIQKVTQSKSCTGMEDTESRQPRPVSFGLKRWLATWGDGPHQYDLPGVDSRLSEILEQVEKDQTDIAESPTSFEGA